MFNWYTDKVMQRKEVKVAGSHQGPERPVEFRPMSKSLQKLYRESLLDQIECLCAKDPGLKEAIFERFRLRNPRYYLLPPKSPSPPTEMPDEQQELVSQILPEKEKEDRELRQSNPTKSEDVNNSSNVPVLPPLRTSHQVTPPKPPSAPQQSTDSSVSKKQFGKVSSYFRTRYENDKEFNKDSSPITEEPELPIENAEPPPYNPAPLQARRTVLGIPVLRNNKSGFEKEICGGYQLQTAQGQVEKVESCWKKFQKGFSNCAPKPPAGPRKKPNATAAPVTKAPVPTLPLDAPSSRDVSTQTEDFIPSPPPTPAPSRNTQTSRAKKSRMPKPAPAQDTRDTYLSPSPPPEPAPSNRTQSSRARKVCKPKPAPTQDSRDTYLSPSPPPEPAPSNRTQSSRARKVCKPKPAPAHATRNPNPSPSPPPEPAPTRRTHPEKVTVSRSQRQMDAMNNLEDLRRLSNPEESVTKCSQLIQDGHWTNRVAALKIIQALAQHHQEDLKANLHELCDIAVEEVRNLRSAVAVVAIDTLTYVALYLQEEMDSQAEKMCRALLLKIAQANGCVSLQKRASTSLGVVVQCCSPGILMNVLVNTGLSHLLPAVRVTAAQQLHLLADELGWPGISRCGKTLTQNFLCAVNKMALDSASGVREHGLAILKDLFKDSSRGFRREWENTVTHKDRPYLEKILAKMDMD